jgi:hypothetical protein
LASVWKRGRTESSASFAGREPVTCPFPLRRCLRAAAGAEHARIAVVDFHAEAVHGRGVDPPALVRPGVHRIPRAVLVLGLVQALLVEQRRLQGGVPLSQRAADLEHGQVA